MTKKRQEVATDITTKPARALTKGDRIVEGDDGKIVGVVLMSDRGCDQMHAHVVLKGGAKWCYDRDYPVIVAV